MLHRRLDAADPPKLHIPCDVESPRLEAVIWRARSRRMV